MGCNFDQCIGINLYLLRLSSGYSIEMAAQKMGVEATIWAMWEAGVIKINASYLWKLKLKFNIDPSDLYIGIIDTVPTNL